MSQVSPIVQHVVVHNGFACYQRTPIDMRACAPARTDHVFFLSRQVRSLETVLPQRDMRACVHRHARACCALITCSFCQGEYVLFETALPPRGGGGICPRFQSRRPLLLRAAAMASRGRLPLPLLVPVGRSISEYIMIAMQTPVPARL